MPELAMAALVGAIAGGAIAAFFVVARLMRAQADAARLGAELDATRRAAGDQQAARAAAEAAFGELARAALRDSRQELVERAESLLTPVRQTLDRVQAQLAEVDKAREGSYQAVTSQLQSLAQAQGELRRAAEGVSRALRSPNVRGRWGEIQLRRIVELAGMLGQCDFVEKPTATDADGSRQTPDLVVRLPGDTNIVVDAKVPIDAYVLASNAATETERQQALLAHARQVRDHIRTLGGKEYWRQWQPAPEFVVMFLPLEPLLAAAFEHDGTLLDQAAALRVIPATPMTLLALLRAVAYGWQQQELARNDEEIRRLGRELYDRLATMVEHLEAVGRNLKQAADGYDRFIGALEHKVLPGARRFKELGVSTTKELETPDLLNLSVRRVRREELGGGDEE